MPQLIDSPSKDTSAATVLPRNLGLFDAVSLVVGSVIGSGIFVSSTEAFRLLEQSPLLSLLAWVTAALISIAGGLCFAELGCMFPRSGAEYEYLKNSFGKLWAYLFTWTQLTVYATGSIAIMSYTSAVYLVRAIWPQGGDELRLPIVITACLVIAVLTAINCFGVKFGSAIQNTLTVVKVSGIVLLLALGVTHLHNLDFSALSGGRGSLSASQASWGDFSLAFGGATVACLWAYDGWNNLSRVTEEARDVNRNIPLAMGISLALITVLYLMVNVLYLSALTPEQMLNGSEVAVSTAAAIVEGNSLLEGLAIPTLIGLLIFLSSAGSTNGSVMSNSRIYFAAARDGLFPSGFAEVHPVSQVPVRSILLQGAIAIAIVLLLGESFSNLLDYFSFSAWVFYGACATALIYLRRTRPDLPRPYRVPLYPWLPLAFIAVATFLIASQVAKSPLVSLLSLVGILSGLLFYRYLAREST